MYIAGEKRLVADAQVQYLEQQGDVAAISQISHIYGYLPMTQKHITPHSSVRPCANRMWLLERKISRHAGMTTAFATDHKGVSNAVVDEAQHSQCELPRAQPVAGLPLSGIHSAAGQQLKQ